MPTDLKGPGYYGMNQKRNYLKVFDEKDRMAGQSLEVVFEFFKKFRTNFFQSTFVDWKFCPLTLSF